ncbi:hypothetical protein ACLVWU_12635 [Bdellovibrio sp. HCB290]|uniref:hypothetical protein n=1 Tax=Bdellovibrio sp. HCB290 TaxID=3394356 RepID=UPI0039B61AC8
MKKGLIILGIAIAAAFLFREGQREGVSTLAGNTTKSLTAQTEKLSNLDQNTNVNANSAEKAAAPVAAPKVVAASSPESSPVQQMQGREIDPEAMAHRQAKAEFVRPQASELRNSLLFRETAWKVWSGVSAVPAVDYDGDGEVVGRSAGYVIVKDTKGLGDDRNFSLKNPIVVFDENQGTVGVVPGRVILVLKNFALLEKIQKEYGLALLNRFDHLRTVFVTSSLQNFNLSKLVNVLKKDPRVERVELEIVSRNRVKN